MLPPDTSPLSWSFGGALAGVSPPVAWSVLGGTALTGVLFIVWSYRQALVSVGPRRRIALCGVRGLVWLGLLVLLAAPTRVRRQYEDAPATRPIAVLVDRSDSMLVADNREHRRIDDALRRWRPMEIVARRTHSDVKTFAFADTVRPAALTATPPLASDRTHLFTSLEQILRDAPSGGWDSVVTLTDGLDTSPVSATAAVDDISRAAAEKGTSLYFVPGRNRYAGAQFVSLRDFNAPPQAAPKSKFRVEAVIDSYQRAARAVPLELTVNGTPRQTTSLALAAGRRLATWSAELEAPESGVMDVVLRVGADMVRAEVRVSRPPRNRILYFQGALDWSYRFLADILKQDTSFVLTPVFNFPNPKAALPPGALRRMPEIPTELDQFDIVILANASAVQFNAQQQAALAKWVSAGGVVLFFTPDDDSTAGFAGSELERMLPVWFAPPQARGTTASRALAGLRGGYAATDRTTLSSFVWENSPRVQEIFAEAGKTVRAPQFSEYAHVARAKPGADVLARHPTDAAPGDSGNAILLAIQRYGTGQSAVLTTDALWRWRLNEPSEDRDPELFWRSLFAWLTRQREYGLRFDHAPGIMAFGEPIPLRLIGGVNSKVAIAAALGQERQTLGETSRDGTARLYTWQPPTEGLWQLTASDDQGNTARHWVLVKKGGARSELSGLPPDEELMRTLAARTGGEVLEQNAPIAWTDSPAPSAPVNERHDPLWHRPWVFAVLLGAYGLDLVLRRRFRML